MLVDLLMPEGLGASVEQTIYHNLRLIRDRLAIVIGILVIIAMRYVMYEAPLEDSAEISISANHYGIK